MYSSGYSEISVLDIGCGRCEEAEELLDHSVHLTGIDLDGETIQKLQKRFPKAWFITADAAQWLTMNDEKFDYVLIRRPDAAHRPQSWKRVFQGLAGSLKKVGRVIVTTPGRKEMEMCRRWLAECGGETEVAMIDLPEEEYLLKAEKLMKGSRQVNSLLHELTWQEDEAPLVCDLRTGRCTTGESIPVDEEKKEDKENVQF
jgi:SAM-dependent methyltransferase